MVMIPVGNRTSHNFNIWAFPEMIIRVTITCCVFFIIQIKNLNTASRWFTIVLFFVWIYRPIYIQIKYLYYSWRDAKHRAECDAVHAVSAPGVKE